ncbi:colicin transporter [Pseudomonas sp. FW305-25]|nr:colicin transporter [Pseudomonas sp. FW305-25]PNA71620.1 colicin transporter [Pseudomonas sp. FW305-76]
MTRFPPLLNQAINLQETEYSGKLQSITGRVEGELATARSARAPNSADAVQNLSREVSIREVLIDQKTAEAQAQKNVADSFYHADFFSRPVFDFFKYSASRLSSPDENYRKWQTSLEAAYRTKLINNEISYLNNQLAQIKPLLEREKLKQTSEWATIAAWAQRYNARKDPIVNQYNLNKANVEQNVQSRLDVASADIPTVVVTPADWVNKSIQVVTQVLSQERNELAAQNAILAGYPGLDFKSRDLKAFLERSRDNHLDPEVAFEQEITAIRAAYRADVLKDEIKSLEDRLPKLYAAKANQEAEAVKAAHTFRMPAAGTTQLSAAAGSIALTAGSSVTLETTIQAAIQALKAALGTVVSVTSAVGIGALTYSSSLGNGELPATILTLPAKSLAPGLPANLSAIAAAGGTVDLPYRIYGDSSKYSVIATQANGGISRRVPVKALSLDPVANAYTFTTADASPVTLTFPIATPANSSTATPAKPVPVPVYTGVTLTPLEIKAVPLPVADQLDIRDAIYIYPADSGLPPIYVVFNSPYEGATTKGVHSGRMYNPEKTGGPIQNLDWTAVTVTQNGINLVKLHTRRFPPSDANKIMTARLERILRGEIPITDVDKRFYTHEIRELERYRALGIADGIDPDDGGIIWNNTHTATLEDYKLKDTHDLFYTPEAIEADDAQIERENR